MKKTTMLLILVASLVLACLLVSCREEKPAEVTEENTTLSTTCSPVTTTYDEIDPALKAGLVYRVNADRKTCTIMESYVRQMTSIKLPAYVDGYKITAIDDSAFSEFTQLESIIISDGVESIGLSAFRGCKALKHIELPDSVKYIGESAFYNCSSLESIRIPKGVNEISDYTFDNCKSLKSVTFHGEITRIGDYEFRFCDIEGCLDLSGKLVHVGKAAFLDNEKIETIILPKTLEYIASRAFDKTLLETRKKIIVFEGTMDEFDEIEKGEDWFPNCLPKETIVCCSDGNIHFFRKF